eukprot:scaffold243863_cov22-Tisochrysis_lutea.AAC.2
MLCFKNSVQFQGGNESYCGQERKERSLRNLQANPSEELQHDENITQFQDRNESSGIVVKEGKEGAQPTMPEHQGTHVIFCEMRNEMKLPPPIARVRPILAESLQLAACASQSP